MRVLGVLLILFSSWAIAATDCEEQRSRVNGEGGEIVKRICKQATGKYLYSINFSGKTLIQSSYLFDEESNRKRLIWVYSGMWGSGNALFLLDLATTPPKAWAFGVGQSTNEFDYASWSAKNSVIAVKDNVKFVYQDHRFILPNVEFAASHSYADTRNWVFSKDGKVISTDLDPKKNVPFAVEIDPSAFK